MTKILSSKNLYNDKLLKLKDRVEKLPTTPILAVIQLEDNIGNKAYLRGIEKTAHSVGVDVKVINSDSNSIYSDIESLNNDSSVNGILIFRPIPVEIDENKINSIIDPDKDVDCMNPLNKAKIYSGYITGFVPFAPKSAMELLNYYDIDVESKKCLIINHSNVVGKPLAMLLLDKFATVEIAHIKTKNLKEHTQKADIIFTAVGKSEFLDASYFNKDSIIIDIGIARNSEGKLTGDLKMESVDGKVKAYSPVPNGVGSLTNLLLLESIIK